MIRLRRASAILMLSLLVSAVPAHAECAGVLWEHSYEVWIDSYKESHRRDGDWKKATAIAAKSDCDDRTVREARGTCQQERDSGIMSLVSGRLLDRSARRAPGS